MMGGVWHSAENWLWYYDWHLVKKGHLTNEEVEAGNEVVRLAGERARANTRLLPPRDADVAEQRKWMD